MFINRCYFLGNSSYHFLRFSFCAKVYVGLQLAVSVHRRLPVKVRDERRRPLQRISSRGCFAGPHRKHPAPVRPAQHLQKHAQQCRTWHKVSHLLFPPIARDTQKQLTSWFTSLGSTFRMTKLTKQPRWHFVTSVLEFLAPFWQGFGLKTECYSKCILQNNGR